MLKKVLGLFCSVFSIFLINDVKNMKSLREEGTNKPW